MKRKLIASLSTLCVIIVAVAIWGVFFIMPRLTSIDAQNAAVAQFALNHTPMTRVSRVYWYTGGPLETTAVGTDAFHRTLYVFVRGEQATVIYQKDVLTLTRAKTLALARFKGSSVVSVIPGFIIPGSKEVAFANSASGGAVFEVTLRLTDGSFAYVYIDMYTGRILWTLTTDLKISL